MTRMIRIFDTTLRDGEQSPGASMNVEEKVMVAKQLARLGVDIIEAGFAYSSPGDFEAVRRIAQEVEGPTICSLARARPEDIDRAWEALKGAPKVRIHTFLSSSDIHLKHPVSDDAGRSQETCGRDGTAGKGLCRRCRVLTDGCQSVRSSVSL